MNPADIFLFVVLLGLAAFAGTLALLSLFPREWDADLRKEVALALGLPLGLILGAMPGFFLSAFFRTSMAYAVLPLWGITLVLILVLMRRELKELFRLHPGWISAGILLISCGFYLWLRLQMSEIRQTEKPMDFAILNGLGTTASLPFMDPWFAGERFPYYHFGPLMLSIPLRLSGMAPEYAYNIFVALLAGMAAATVYGAVRLRGGGRPVALVGSALLLLAGTFDGARQLWVNRTIAQIDMWPSSRRVADTITEWPLFSFWLGDLHPHVVAIPFLLLFIAVAGTISGKWGVILDAAILAALLSANPWDLPASLLVLAAANLVARTWKEAAVRSVLTVLAAVPLLLPFLRSPRPEFQGIRLVKRFTTAPEAFLHLGPFVIVLALSVGLALVRSRSRSDEAFLAATIFPALGLALTFVSKSPVLGLGISFAAAVLYLLPKLSGTTRAGFLLGAAAVILVSIPEVIAVKDPYGEDLHRMNTVFKCYSGGALIFWVASSLLLPLALASRRLTWTVRGILAFSVLGVSIHPLSLMYGRMRSDAPGALNGMAWIEREAPGDYKAIQWLRAKAPFDAVILEAVGGAYTDHGRISTFSGRPAFLGWAGHQGLWRGAAGGDLVASREADAKTLFKEADVERAKELLSRRGVRYVVVGPLERKEYGEDAFPARAAFAKAFEADGTVLYEVAP